MNNITRLLVFDFDETFFRMPGYTDRFSVERVHPELNFPTPYSFYDHPTSMNMNIHNIQLISPVYDDWLEGSADLKARTILITHRIKSLRPCAEEILERYGVEFDEMYFLGRESEKITVLEKELSYLPNVKEISVYEDSLEQLIKYHDFYYEYVLGECKKGAGSADDFFEKFIFLNMQFVDKSKVINLSDFSIGQSRRIQLQ